MELTGTAVPLIERVTVADFWPRFTLSQSGTLVYHTGGGAPGDPREFVWVTRSGEATPVDPRHTFITANNFGLALSPDETRIAFSPGVEGDEDIYIKHLPDGPAERITFSEDPDRRPFWTPDGQSVTYSSGPSPEDRNAWSKRADGTGDRVLVMDDERSFAQGSWSPDGEWLVFRAAANDAMGIGLRDILSFRPGVDTIAVPLVASPEFEEHSPAISPDGRWLAYSSNEGGDFEVFVVPFPNVDSTRVRVSIDGGRSPVWANEGQLFFVNPDRGLVAAQIDAASGQVLERETLFTVPAEYQIIAVSRSYDVTSNGEQFLMVRRHLYDAQGPVGYIIFQNVFELLRERVPN